MMRPGRKLELLLALTSLDLKIRYGEGPLRLAKWFVDPLGFIAIYLLLLAFVLERPGEARGLTIACAVIPFQLAARTLANALGIVRSRRGLMKTFHFPRSLLPAVSTLTESVGYLASLVLLAILMAIYGIDPSASLLWVPILVAISIGLALAFAYLGALAGYWFPELAIFGPMSMRALFFLASGVIALEETTGAANDVLRLNPLTGVFEAYRSVIAEGHAPAAWELLYPLGFAALLLGLMVPIFNREQRDFAKI
jgi:lipopolysaccharide transport system permease protein